MRKHDVIVIGGGPSGSTAARCSALRGLDVLLLEGEHHPRFRIGESFLPRTLTQIRDLGLEKLIQQIPQTRKRGASFALGGEEELTDFRFREALLPAGGDAFNIERAPFDAALLRAAEEAGAEVRQGAKVENLCKLGDDSVVVETRDGTHQGRLLLDASGPSTVVGRHLDTRRALPGLQKVAYFAHLEGVSWRSGEEAGYPIVIMCEEGWFWFIPLDDVRVSVGLVLDAGIARQVGVAARQMLEWGLARCPIPHRLTRNANLPESNRVAADFSYSCRPYAGPGYFLLGDAATFLDPVFSTGVCLGMMSAASAARAAERLVMGLEKPRRARREYIRHFEAGSSVLFRLVRRFYSHSFRELLLSGHGPLQVHRAVIAALSGSVFPKPALSLRWRLRLFELLVELHGAVPLVPRREPFSLRRAPRLT